MKILTALLVANHFSPGRFNPLAAAADVLHTVPLAYQGYHCHQVRRVATADVQTASVSSQ